MARNLLNANREAESRIQNAQIDRLAAAQSASFGRAIAYQMRQAAESYGRGDEVSGAVLSNTARLVEAYVATYRRSSQIVGPRILESGKALHGRDIIVKAEDGSVPVLQYWNRLVSQWIEANAAARVTQVNQTTIDQLRAIIAQGTADGLGVLGIQQAILSSIRDLTPIRARAISRTESHAGAMASGLEAAKSIAVDTHKDWNAVGDSRTREDHDAADGQQVPLDSFFRIGGARLQHPGDPRAPADQVVNCRCVLGYPVL